MQAGNPKATARQGSVRLLRLIRSLVRPYRGTLIVILLAMLVQTAMSVAGPWPLKIILDNVVGTHKLSPWLDDLLRPILSGGSKMQIAAAAAIAAVLIAVLGAVASYVANYYTTSVGQWVANDLRVRTYHHLQQLSLRYYDTPPNRHATEHHHLRRADDPELRLFVHAGHHRGYFTIMAMLFICSGSTGISH